MEKDTSLLQLLKTEDFAVYRLYHCCTPAEETQRKQSLEDSQKYYEEQIAYLKESIQRCESNIQRWEEYKKGSSQKFLNSLNESIRIDQQSITNYQEELRRYQEDLERVQRLMSVTLQEECERQLKEARANLRDYFKTYINKED